ncbi:MAG: cupin domain-containing protein [Ramlibacter sp.]
MRRIVTVDGVDGCSFALGDAPVSDVLRDAARPGFESTRVWATDCTPAAALTVEAVAALPGLLEPPPRGALFRIVTVPPDSAWNSNMSPEAAREFFVAAGAEHLWRGAGARQPYLQQSSTLDLCVVLEGELHLVLDTAEVALRAGDSIVQRGTRHAWSNRSARPAVIAISSHDGEHGGGPQQG